MAALQWSTHGAIVLVVTAAAVAMAAFVYTTRPDRRQNRLLAAAISLGGLSSGFYFGAPMFAAGPELARAMIVIGISLLVFLPPVYLLFLGTIRTPLAAPLRSRWAFPVLAAYAVVVQAVWLATPERFIDGMHYYEALGAWHLDLTAEHAGLRRVLLGALALVELFGLLVAGTAWRRATTEGHRQQAAAFAAAFGTRDLLGAAFIVYFGVRTIQMSEWDQSAFILALPTIDLVFYMLLGYGMLKVQLFDIDLKLKVAFERSLVVAPFAAAVFVVSEAIERSVPVQSFWLGVASAGAIVLLLRPLRSVAAWVADRLFPSVEATPEYLGGRSRDVYRHALQVALEDGAIVTDERRVLQRLAGDLALSGDVVAKLETEVHGRLPILTDDARVRAARRSLTPPPGAR